VLNQCTQAKGANSTSSIFLHGPSVGSVGDAYDNALAETIIGLYKTECTPAGSPFRNGPLHRLSDLEEATAA
jgi:transposase InsO family protein